MDKVAAIDAIEAAMMLLGDESDEDPDSEVNRVMAELGDAKEWLSKQDVE